MEIAESIVYLIILQLYLL